MKIKAAKISFSSHKCNIAGRFVLGERPGWNVFVGMGIIFIGLIVIDGRIRKRFSVSKLLKEVV
jgi:hypothetical protein